MTSSPCVVAIDGPSGVGKSTVAARVAEELGLSWLETGAMYRALGWRVLEDGIDPTDRNAVEALARCINLQLVESSDHRVEVLLDGRSLSSEVRSPEVSEATSIASSHPGVRREMVKLQRKFAYRRGAVLEGRDIGTRVFPDTPYKFFLTAPSAVRAERRRQQLEGAGGESIDAAAIAAEIEERDSRDSKRSESPLTMDPSYTVLDTGVLSIDEVVTAIVRSVG